MIRSGFTFVEVMVTVVIMVIVAALLLPLAMPSDAGRAQAAARLLASDLEYAQVLALSRPQTRVALHIDDDGQGWQIVDADDPSTALVDRLDALHAGRKLDLRIGDGRGAVIEGALVSPGGLLMVFTPLGGLESNIPVLKTTVDGASASISVHADTGFAAVLD